MKSPMWEGETAAEQRIFGFLQELTELSRKYSIVFSDLVKVEEKTDEGKYRSFSEDDSIWWYGTDRRSKGTERP